MSQDNLISSLGQVAGGEAGQVFRDHLLGAVRVMLTEVMAEEVAQLCGPKHQEKHLPNKNNRDDEHKKKGEIFRAGSIFGRVLLHNEHKNIARPRVRKKDAQVS